MNAWRCSQVTVALGALSVVVGLGWLTTGHAAAQVDGPDYRSAMEALRYPERDEVPDALPTAIRHLRATIEQVKTPSDRAGLNLLLALCLNWDGEVDEAISVLQSVLTTDPTAGADFPEVKIEGLDAEAQLGDCYRDKGDWAQALVWWEKCLQRNPDASAVAALVMRARHELALADRLEAGPIAFAGESYVPSQPDDSQQRLLASADGLAGPLGITVTRDAAGAVKLTHGLRVLTMTVGSQKADINGKQVALPVAPVEQDGKLLVPLRYVAEVFGFPVRWEPLARIA